MKKYITIAALLASCGSAMAATATEVNGSITLDGTQSTDARLDFKYSSVKAQSVTTTVDYVTIEGTDGYGLGTTDTTLTFNVQYNLNATGQIKLPTADMDVFVTTNLNASELASLDAGDFVQRMVVTADYFGNVTMNKISNPITIGNISEYNLAGGELVFWNSSTNTYYNKSDATFNGNYVTIDAAAEALTLDRGTLYTVAKITANSGASVKGLGFIAAIPEPATFGLLAGLGALALVGTRRRRR